jgi:RES domain-containing protein
LHALERIVRVLERAPLVPYTDYAYRIVAEKWRESPLSALGSVRAGGRYNAPNSFPVLYCADNQITALMEVEALFTTADGQLRGVPRNPDLILTIQCALSRVLDLTVDDLYADLGTSFNELVSFTPSRFIANARGELTPTQVLGAACSFSGNISAIKVPSAANADGFCLDIFVDSLIENEWLSIADNSGRIAASIKGTIPVSKRV